MPKRLLPNGFTMNYERHPRLLPLDTLFIHGNVASNAWWRPSLQVAMENATPHEGAWIMADWRGCGESGPPLSENEFDVHFLAHDYLELMDALEIKKMCLVGHSTGAAIVLQLLRLAPERFDRAVLVNPVPTDGTPLSKERELALLRMQSDFDFCRHVIASTAPTCEESSDLVLKLTQDAFQVHSSVWLGVPRMLARLNMAAQLPLISHPVLVLHGENDTLCPAENSRSLASQLACGTYKELPGLGHSPNVEAPELFLNHVQNFLFQRP